LLAAGSRGAALSETAAVAPNDTWLIAATAPIAEKAFASGTGRYFVNRATARAEELTEKELRAGARRLTEKVRRYRPRVVAVLGIGAYRLAFASGRVRLGEQPERIGCTSVWVLPNPSGLNASYQLPELARLFRKLRMVSGKRKI
jgi:G:T/U-mismatch repair DNA glycosylase